MREVIVGFIFIFVLALSVSAQIEEAQKIDKFGNTNCDDYGARIDLLLTEINNFSDAKGYVFVYEGKLEQFIYDKNAKFKKTRYVSPEIGMAKEIIGYLKKHLLFRNFPSNKIVFIEAGYREKYAVEFWLVPDKAIPPKPTPTLKKIKQRKPKLKQFDFCGEM
jgi:hypothetical protein